MTNDQTECLARVDARIAELQTEIDAQDKEVSEMVSAINGARLRSLHANPPLSGFHYELRKLNKLKSELRVLRALRTVIEKHEAYEESNFETCCKGCELALDGEGVHVSFPCQTITDIKKELGI